MEYTQITENTLEKVVANQSERGAVLTGCFVPLISLSAVVVGGYMVSPPNYELIANQKDYTTLAVGLIVGGGALGLFDLFMGGIYGRSWTK